MRAPQRALGTAYGALLIDSMPPATTKRASPRRMSRSAMAMADMPERHTLLMVVAGTVMGMPPRIGRLAGRDLAGAGLEHVPEVDLVHPVGGQAGPLQGGGDGHPAELHRRQGAEGAPVASERGANGRADDRAHRTS